MIKFDLDAAIDYNTKRLGQPSPDFARAVAVYQTYRGDLLVDGKAGPVTQGNYESFFDIAPEPTVVVGDESRWEPPLVDRREHARPSYQDRDGQRIYYTPKIRLWRVTTAVCLHQTACVLGERPARWDTVGAHIGVTQSGQVIWLHDFDRMVIHGNAWSARTIGIEVDGLFAGVEGDRSTVWRGGVESHLSEVQAAAVRWTIRWCYETIAENEGEMTAIVAHRQSSKSRRNDPGSEIWRKCALPMMAELDVTDGASKDHRFEVGGYPIPEAWDPSRVGVPY